MVNHWLHLYMGLVLSNQCPNSFDYRYKYRHCLRLSEYPQLHHNSRNYLDQWMHHYNN